MGGSGGGWACREFLIVVDVSSFDATSLFVWPLHPQGLLFTIQRQQPSTTEITRILHRLQVKDLHVTAIFKYIVNIIALAFRAAPAAPTYCMLRYRVNEQSVNKIGVPSVFLFGLVCVRKGRRLFSFSIFFHRPEEIPARDESYTSKSTPKIANSHTHRRS